MLPVDKGAVGATLNWRGYLVFLVLVVLLAAGCNSQQTSVNETYGLQKNSSKLQVGFITVGSASDWGFNYQHNRARLYMQAMLPDKVNTVIVENIPENADVERVMQRMVDAGAQLIFSTSYGYADFCHRVATKNPSVVFMQCLAPTKPASNIATYTGNIWESCYLSGVAAARTVGKNARFGFIGSHPIPPIHFAVNAFALGIKSVNGDTPVDVVYTGSWNNPAAETEAVKSLASRGVNVIYTVVDSTLASVQAAERSGIYSISHHADLSDFAPKLYITGPTDNWGPLYVDVALQVINKTWQPKSVDGGFDKGYVAIAPFGRSVDGASQNAVFSIMERMKQGSFQVFTGPIEDSSGKLRVQPGQTLTVAEVNSMDWLVKGVKAAGAVAAAAGSK